MADPAPAPARAPLLGRLNLELLIVILLGIVSVTTAYSSFQASLYDSGMARNYASGQNAQTEAESLYLEANQRYIRDVETWGRLTELSIEMNSADPVAADTATQKFDTLHFVAVDAVFDAAIGWSQEQNDANPDEYVGPFDSPAYQEALYGPWREMDAASADYFAAGEADNGYSDEHTLNSVLMAITLFLLGVAAVLKQRRMTLVLVGIGTAIYLVALVRSAMVPFVGL